MIERHWSGIAKREKAKEYVSYLKKDTLRQLSAIPGFISARILERDRKEGIEFLIITTWQNPDSIEAFAGSNIEMAVVPEQVQEMMLAYDKTVQHYAASLSE